VKKLLSISFLILTFLVQNSYSQDTTSYLVIPDKFFSIMEDKGNDAAIDYIFKTNKYLRTQIAGNIKIKNELNKLTKLLGKFYGSDLIETIKAGNNYIRLYYLAKYDRQPLLFIFTMYRPNKKWRIQQLRFTEKVGDYLDKKRNINKQPQ
jgi:hypothetical protein